MTQHSLRRRAPRVRFSKDAEGKPVVRVELSNAKGLFATIDADAWETWCNDRHPSLFLNDNGKGAAYVRAYRDDVRGQVVTVARELLRLGRGEVVRHLNGGRLDLRRANLVTGAGPARGQTLRHVPANLQAA